MENIHAPFRGIVSDVGGRVSCYKQDWLAGLHSGFRIFSPSAYMFFASALPAIAFGEQLSHETEGSISAVETLISTAICGMIQSLVGGQPLVIVGVAEPTVMMYKLLYKFAKQRQYLGSPLFLPWVAWVNLWTALILMIMAVFNACEIIDRITRIAEELLGMLIAVLFLQEAIKGIKSEFKVPKSEDPTLESYQYEWLYANGLLAVIFALGLLYTSLKSRRARSWRYGTSALRNFLADFGVPLSLFMWTALSFCVPSKAPNGVPRRLFSPHQPWEQLYHWTVVKDMGKVSPEYIVGAIIPAIMVAGLFFFEHNVASKMAQQKEFNLKNPSAYHLDIFLLACMTLVCGLLGLPPSYGLLPHSPMHTKSLAALKRYTIRTKMVESVRRSMKENASNSEIYNNMQQVFIDIDKTTINGKGGEVKELEGLKQVVMKGDDEKERTGFMGEIKRSASKCMNSSFDPETHIDPYLPVRVNEQRLSNLLQSILVALLVFAVPIVKLIPSSLLWGYFAYMAIDSLSGNQFWERLQLLLVPPTRLYKVMEKDHVSFLDSVPLRHIVGFTVFQLGYLMLCFGVTWIPTAGIMFPLFFFLLIVIRHRFMPMFFQHYHLTQLDAVEYEEVAVVGLSSRRSIGISFRKTGDEDRSQTEEEAMSDGEILDEITTSRGEFKVRTLKARSVSFREDRTFSFRLQGSGPSSSKDHLNVRSVSFRDDKHLKSGSS